MMPVVDDGSVIRVAQNHREELSHSAGKRCSKSVFLAAGQQNIVGRDTGLPGIEQLAVCNFQSSCVHICRRVQNARRLAAEFQGGGR